MCIKINLINIINDNLKYHYQVRDNHYLVLNLLIQKKTKIKVWKIYKFKIKWKLLKRYKSQRDGRVPKTRMLLQRRGRRYIEPRRCLGKTKEGRNRLKKDIGIGKKMMIAKMIRKKTMIVKMKGGGGTIEIEMIEVLKEENKRKDEDQHLVDVLYHQRDAHLPTEKDQPKNKAKKSA